MLEVRNLAKRFGQKDAVRELSFSIAKGESFGLLGPNGAGKSTTIAMISGLLTPTAGEVLVGGVDPRKEPMAAKRLMGVVPQDIALYPTLSARENLAFWGQMYGLYGQTLARRIDQALEIVSLKDRQKERINTYSGGMKRRINIAASLLHQPELLIMDEPTVGIDPQSRSNILETVRRLNTDHGITVLYTSHYMEEVEFLCGRVGIIDHGRLIALGSLEEVRRLTGSAAAIRLKIANPDGELAALLTGIPGVSQARLDDGVLVALASEPAETLAPILTALSAAGQKVLGVEVDEPNLEAVFLHLTGRALRD